MTERDVIMPDDMNQHVAISIKLLGFRYYLAISWIENSFAVSANHIVIIIAVIFVIRNSGSLIPAAKDALHNNISNLSWI